MHNKLEIIPLELESRFSKGDSVIDALNLALKSSGSKFEASDVLVVASKIISYAEESIVSLETIKPSHKAKLIAKATSKDPRMVQVIIDESNGEIIPSFGNTLLCETRYGFCANAGVDKSNAPENHLLTLPKNASASAKKLMNQIDLKFELRIPVIISDTRTFPLRRGTFAVSIGQAGIPTLIDERGKVDLFGKEYNVTVRAYSDSLAIMGNFVMGETDEKRPFVIIRGLKAEDNESYEGPIVSKNDCLFLKPFLLGEK